MIINVYRLGLGALLPQDAQAHSGHQSFRGEDKLRKRFLGKQASKNLPGHKSDLTLRPMESVGMQYKLSEKKSGSGSEDDEGRTAFQGKNTRPTSNLSNPTEPQRISSEGASDVTPSEVGRMTSNTAPSRKRSSSYLDEVLLARSEKRRKRKKIKSSQE